MISADCSSSVYLFSQNLFWDEQKCRTLREIAQKSNVEDAGVYRNGKTQVDPNLRKTRRILLDQELFAEIGNSFLSLKPRIEEHFQLTLNGSQGVQFLQYRAGDYFHAHVDESEPASDSTRKISIILFLNSSSESVESGFEGGHVVLYKDRNHFLAGDGMHIVPEEGLLIAFSSYILHEVQEVITGVRYSLVSWFY